MGYIAYELSNESREKLKKYYPPKFQKFIGDHITYKFGVSSNQELPSENYNINVIGYCFDKNGLEALLVSIDNSIHRSDGSFYHITWSLNPEKFKPVNSNNILKNNEIESFYPIKIKAYPIFRK